MSGEESRDDRVRFGVFQFNLQSLELRRQGRPVRLQHQPAKVLAYLVERAGHLATREEMAEHLWSDTHVDFDQGLNNAIRHLRRMLGDSAEAPVYIETVPRMGYRFIAPIERVPQDSSRQGSAPEHPGERGEAEPSPASADGMAGGQAGVGSSATVADSRVSGRESDGPAPDSSAGGPGQRQGERAGRPQRISLAEDRADHLPQASSRVDGPVASMPRPQNGHSWKLLGSAVLLVILAVAAWLVLSGRVPYPVLESDQNSPDQNDTDQNGPSLSSVDQNAEQGDELYATGKSPNSAVAQAAYLRALKLLSSQDWVERRASIKSFEEAVRLDQDFAPARFHWARATWLTAGESQERREEALRRLEEVMAMDSDAPAVHLLRAEIAFYHEWDAQSARNHYRRALELGEGLKEVHRSYGLFLALMGRSRAAQEQAEKALDLDASSVESYRIAGMIYLRGGDPRRAIELCGQAREISQGRQQAVECLLGAHLALGDTEEALQVLSQWLVTTDPPQEVYRRIEEAENNEERLERHLRSRFHLISVEANRTYSERPPDQSPLLEMSVFGELASPGRLALAAMHGGGEEFALNQLAIAHQRRSPSFLRWAGSPAFAALAAHPDYLELFKESPLPQPPTD
ncbi:MAG TPA: winged helix-turn-helix domain-containing protein [Acidobacteriota bacterium]|nr:winged helix-turn-helix domain-containing protein [Acidobacteriota bacterium]